MFPVPAAQTLRGMTNTTTTTDALQERIREARALHAAGQAGDFDTVLAAYDPQVVWTNDAAAGPWAGRVEGIDAVAEMFTEFLTFFDGTFTQELLDVCVSADRTVTLLREVGVKDGHRFDNRAVWVDRYAGGRIVEVTTLDIDRADAERFWEAVGVPGR
jgi:ketosteroid isomerase-like protein